MEQHIGHRTYYQNLRRFIEPLQEVEAHWVEVTYEERTGIWRRRPFLPGSLQGMLAGRAQVQRGLRGHQSDVVVFNTQVPAALGGRVVGQRPYILCTDITPIQYDRMGAHYGHSGDGQGPISRYKHRVNRQLFHRAARILPWSSWVKTSLVEDYGVAAQHIEVLPPGVDIDVWKPGPVRDGERPVRVLFVGGDFERKGGDELLEVFSMLPTGMLELFLVTRSPVEERPGVTVFNQMRPNSAELRALYQSSDLFVLPTKAEAFGIAAVEASAVGLPIIATRVGGLSDIVLDGRSGFLVEPGNISELAQRLQLLARNPQLRQQYGRAARAHALAHFNARANAMRFLDVLHAAVDINIVQPVDTVSSLRY